MEFVFAFAIVFIQMLFINQLKVMEIVRAFRISGVKFGLQNVKLVYKTGKSLCNSAVNALSRQ